VTITFSFGENWQSYLATLSDDAIRRAAADIAAWIPPDEIAGRSVLDIGSGSGIHSLCFQRFGADRVVSIDADPASVDATLLLWEAEGSPESWQVSQASILDEQAVAELPPSEIVYSWGVLHHTGDLWKALHYAASLVKDDGRLWIAIYQAGPSYERHVQLKRRYNAASKRGKRFYEWREIAKTMAARARRGKNPLRWNQRRERGMSTYHDIVDWLGGLPYEVANEDEIVRFGLAHDLVLERIRVRPEGACSNYLFRRSEPCARAERSGAARRAAGAGAAAPPARTRARRAA
jgi:SAM-dependent methyltransferase